MSSVPDWHIEQRLLLFQDGRENDRVISDLGSVTAANQRRMRADPFEALLLNMGMSLDGVDVGDGSEGEDGGGGEGGDGGLQCRPS